MPEVIQNDTTYTWGLIAFAVLLIGVLWVNLWEARQRARLTRAEKEALERQDAEDSFFL